MRTIRFRGKRIDNGKWVYGDLVHDCDGKPIINIEGYSDRGTAIHCRYLVKPETVGQFTGLLDKNGKEIYENDILLIAGMYYQIVFQDGCFGFKNDYCKFLPISLYVLLRSEVMGNVHDNPELLKGESI